MCTVDDLKPGDKAIVKKNRIKGNLGKRFHEMGFTRGAEVEFVKKAPLGYPIELKICGFSLAVRKEEAQAIEVED